MEEEKKEMTLEGKTFTPLRGKLEEIGFEFTEDFYKGSMFLFPDGKYLNLASDTNRQALTHFQGCIGCVAHHNLDSFIVSEHIISLEEEHDIREYSNSLKKPFFICLLQERIVEHTDGAIVLNDGTNYKWENCYIDLPVEKRPTTAQFNKLTLWVDNLIYTHQPRLNIGFGDELLQYDFRHEECPTTDEIIKDIKRLYHMI